MKASSAARNPDGAPKTGRLAELRAFVRFGFTCGLLGASALATTLAIVLLVPDETDYAKASVLKHQRLAHIDTRKIVLVGGSNLAFGIDSTMIERATGCPVVNMGMNGYLGVRYMLEEVKRELNPHDIVVLAFEWDNYYKSVDGTSEDLLGIAKANPAASMHLSLVQLKGLAFSIPNIAHRKIVRLFTAVIEGWTGIDSDPLPLRLQLLENVPTVAGFTSHGDFVNHLNVSWPYTPATGIIPDDRMIESDVVPLIHEFAAEMTKRGTSVIVSYTPITHEFFERHQSTLEEVHNLMKTTSQLLVPSPPVTFTFDERHFFDTVYHLNADGRPLRTQRLIEDLTSHLRERVRCPEHAPQPAAARSGMRTI